MEKVSRQYVEKIRTEMNAAIKAGRPQSFFNNFNLNFSHYREIIERTQMMDSPNADHWKRHANFSELFMQQTPRQFFDTIDQVVNELHLSGEVAALVSDPNQKKLFFENSAPKIFIKLIPAFLLG